MDVFSQPFGCVFPHVALTQFKAHEIRCLHRVIAGICPAVRILSRFPLHSALLTVRHNSAVREICLLNTCVLFSVFYEFHLLFSFLCGILIIFHRTATLSLTALLLRARFRIST